MQYYIKKLYTSRYLPWFIIVIGVLLRLRQYLFNKSLWVDEAIVVLNIIHSSYLDLTQPLNFVEHPPILFLWFEKTVTLLLGNSEYSLRLIPLISSSLSIYFFYKLSRLFLKRYTVLITLILYCILTPLIYYAAEVKPYGVDIGIYSLIYFITLSTVRSRISRRKKIIFLGIFGAVSIYLSHPAIFVLGGISIYLFIDSLINHNKRNVAEYFLIGGIWAVAFMVNFYYIERFSVFSQELRSQWAFILPPNLISPQIFIWFYKVFYEFFMVDLLYSLDYFAVPLVLFFLLGVLSLFLKNRGNLLLITLPIFLTLAASLLDIYVFYQRAVVFLIAPFLILIGFGIEHLRLIATTLKIKHRTVLIGLLVTVLLSYSGYQALELALHPIDNEAVKPVLAYLQTQKKKGDVIYLYYASQYAYKYYANRYKLDDLKTVTGIERTNKMILYMRDLNRVMGNRRVWILISHDYSWGTIDEADFFLNYLNSRGEMKSSFESTGAGIYLFDLSRGGNL